MDHAQTSTCTAPAWIHDSYEIYSMYSCRLAAGQTKVFPATGVQKERHMFGCFTNISFAVLRPLFGYNGLQSEEPADLKTETWRNALQKTCYECYTWLKCYIFVLLKTRQFLVKAVLTQECLHILCLSHKFKTSIMQESQRSITS